MQSNRLKHAIQYLNAGFSVIPTRADKRPFEGWKQYQTELMSLELAQQQFSEDRNIALICGAVSSNVEAIDVDCKYDLRGKLWEQLAHAIKEADAALYDRLVIQTTPSGGYHILYRCETIEGNKKLAMRPATQAELDKYNATAVRKIDKPEQLPKVLVETRGEGGYILVAPSDGYNFIQGNPSELPTITPDERAMLMQLCGSLNEVPIVTKKEAAKPTAAPTPKFERSGRVGDDYNEQHGIIDVLEGYGWTRGRDTLDTRNDSGVLMVRPGSERERSAIAYPSKNMVFVHSTSTPLPSETALSPFAVFAWYEHAGDFSAAAKVLATMGYGAASYSRAEAQPFPTATPTPTHANGKPQPTAKSDGGGIESNPYFRILGFSKTDNGVQAFYFFQKASNTLLRLTASAMSKNNLMTLAPLLWWEQNFAGAKGMATDMAIDWLIQTGSRKGQFNEKNVRGRGAWVDDKRIVIHAGDKLIADGKEIPFHELKSKFVYEAGEEMDITSANPLTATEAKKLVEICGLLSWKRSINSDLLAGWCAVAPLCGALDWRPHLWIVGEAGSGKSTAFNEIVKRMLGGTALNVQGNTSESGLRQTLKFDARPVVFDEAEAEDRNAQARMQDVLALMRAASSSDGGKIIKGGQDGQAREYIIRSCFAYASIVFQATQQADISRITVLETKKINRAAEATERLGKFNRAVLETLTDDYVRRFQARAIKMLPTILENAKVFKSAVVQVLGQQRAGDQLGVLLAGAHSLHHDGSVDFAYALDLVQNADWSEEQGAEKQTDQMRLLSKIVEQVVRIDGRTERTVGELVSLAAAAKVEDFISERTANDTLKRLGLKVDKSELYISNTAEWVKRTLRDTAWANNHAKLLERIDGARKVASTRFADGLKGTATAIPLALLVEGED